MSTSKLDKVYNPVNIEEKWYQYWLENNYFKSKPDPNKEPYTIVILLQMLPACLLWVMF